MSSTDYSVVPKAEEARQAVHALRGFVYQVASAALTWLDLDERSRIYLEVAEDYARVARGEIEAYQVKDSPSSRATLNSESVRAAITNFVKLTELNPQHELRFHYLSTATIGKESNFPIAIEKPGLIYWRSAASGSDVTPLRLLLTGGNFPEPVREFVRSRDDNELRQDLLRRIHWDCGQPNLTSLRREFRDRLINVAWDQFNIPSQGVEVLSDVLLARVLNTSIIDGPENRKLSRGDLIETIHQASRVSIAIQTFEKLAGARSNSAGTEPSEKVLPPWIVAGDGLPTPKRIMRRDTLECQLEEKLREHCVLYLHGASGVGKTITARGVAASSVGKFFLVDFRDATVEESAHRLSVVISKLGDLKPAIVVLDDLNHVDDKRIENHLSVLVDALVRKDSQLIVTTYNTPTARVLSALGHSMEAVIACPYFSKEESSKLVERYGGDSATWGQLAHASGAFGHPQLVHAFVAGVSSRGWRSSEITSIVDSGLSTIDVDAERMVARRLIAELPQSSKQLLYRLSLGIGTFTRSTALRISMAPPPLRDAGESLDMLIGPWIEVLGIDEHRVSPLAATSGRDMLADSEKQKIHHDFASVLIDRSEVGAWEIDKIAFHAIFGKNAAVLAAISHKINASGDDLARYLAESGSALQLLDTNKPIYPESPALSCMLRLSQFTVLTSSNNPKSEWIKSSAEALLRETEMQASPAREMFRLLALAKILGTIGIANHLPGWFQLLMEFRELIVGQTWPSIEELDLGSQAPAQVLFRIGLANLSKVSLLEEVFEALDKIEPSVRAEMLAPLEDGTTDYPVLINSPWVAEQTHSIDPKRTEERYRHMEALSREWGIPEIPLLCSIAIAVMRDEYGEDHEGALAALDEAVTNYGDVVPLRRARAKVYWRAQKHDLALPILREIADAVGLDSPIERSFALREAAISAAKVGDWKQARMWFHEAKRSAEMAKLTDMAVMAAGLAADAGVASQHLGRSSDSIGELAEALALIDEIPADSSLRAAHSHRWIRHCVLWLQAQLEGRVVMLGDKPMTVVPGVCSNPEPSEQIASLPLGAMEITLYLLAQCEALAGDDDQVVVTLERKLNGGRIPLLEPALRRKRVWRFIVSGSTDELAEELVEFGEAIENFPQVRGNLHALDLLNPEIEKRRPISMRGDSTLADRAINDALLALLVANACWGRAGAAVRQIMAAGQKLSRHRLACSCIHELTQRATSETFEGLLIRDALLFDGKVTNNAQTVARAGIRFLQQALNSQFKVGLVQVLAVWNRENWERIVVGEAFSLTGPRYAVPRIQSRLASLKGDADSVLQMTLAGADAVGIVIPHAVVDQLKHSVQQE